MLNIDRNNTSFTFKLIEFFKNIKTSDEYSFLKYYQNIVREYVRNVNFGGRGILINHKMGLGKSILAVAIAMDFIKELQPIMLLTKSLQDNMRKSIHKYVNLRGQVDKYYPLSNMTTMELDEWITANFSFVSMNASNMLKQLDRATEAHVIDEFDAMLEKKFENIVKMTSLDGKILIIDEAHNFFRAVTNGSKNAIGLYEKVINAKNLVVIFLTGTAISNDPFELAVCFNMIGSKNGQVIFPEEYRQFNKLFVGETGIKNKEKFQNRIFGLVSYVDHKSTPGALFGISANATMAKFPDDLGINIIKVPMDPEQYVMYQLARDKERDEKSGTSRNNEGGRLTKPKSSASSTYRVRSRQLSNFCPPTGMLDVKNVDELPDNAIKSTKFDAIYGKIMAHDGQIGLVYSQFTGVGGLGSFARYLELKGWKRYSADNNNVKNQIIGGNEFGYGPDVPNVMSYFAASDDQNVDNISKITFSYAKNAQKSITTDDVTYPNAAIFVHENCVDIGYILITFTNENDEKCSGKVVSWKLQPKSEISIDDIIASAINAINCPAPTFKKQVWGGSVDPTGLRKTFAVIDGSFDADVRTQLQNIYNSDENKRGGIIDLLLISSVGVEGLDLKNGRFICAMDVYWTWIRMLQLKYRLIRNDSHVTMEENEQNVITYLFLSVPPKSEWDSRGHYLATTDVELYDEAIKQQVINDSFTDAITEVSIECAINNGKNCRSCNPTNEKLFGQDIVLDIRKADPCKNVRETEVIAQEIVVDDKKYYYAPSTQSIYKYVVFRFDQSINANRQMKEFDPMFTKIIDQINVQNSVKKD